MWQSQARAGFVALPGGAPPALDTDSWPGLSVTWEEEEAAGEVRVRWPECADTGRGRRWRARGLEASAGAGGSRGVRESVGTRWARPRRAEACLACPRLLRVYLSALERQAHEPAGRVGDGADFRQGSCEGGGVRLQDPALTKAAAR